MTAPTESPADLDMPSVDDCPACECTVCHPSEHPKADLRVKLHGHPHDSSTQCCDFVLLLCEPCFEELRTSAERYLAGGCAHTCCIGCHRPLLKLSDIILAVIRL